MQVPLDNNPQLQSFLMHDCNTKVYLHHNRRQITWGGGGSKWICKVEDLKLLPSKKTHLPVFHLKRFSLILSGETNLVKQEIFLFRFTPVLISSIFLHSILLSEPPWGLPVTSRKPINHLVFDCKTLKGSKHAWRRLPLLFFFLFSFCNLWNWSRRSSEIHRPREKCCLYYFVRSKRSV